MSRKKFFFSYGGLFLLALLCRIIFAWFANNGSTGVVRPDTWGYLTPAYSMVNGGFYDGTRRPPGLPVVAAMVFKCGGGEQALSWTLALLSAFTVLAVARAGFLYGGHRAGLIAGGLYAFSPTVLGNAPLLLSDTLAGVFAALQYWFFLEFHLKKRDWGIFACTVAAAIGVLIRPVNMLFILPLAVLIAVSGKGMWRKKLFFAGSCTVIFLAIIFPWMCRNAAQGAGFCIDTNTGAMYHQNGAMLLGEVTGRGYEFEKQRIIAEQEVLFRDNSRFPDEKSREQYRISRYKELVKNHFAIWLKQQCNYQILIPDVPACLECFGVTSSDRGTMAVLKEQGIFPAIRHYFGENWLFLVLLTMPLALVTLVCYAGCAWTVAGYFRDLRKNYPEILIFGAFVSYYLFLPGAITAPRYQIPALPCICVLAALVPEQISRFRMRKGEAGSNEGQYGEVSTENIAG